MSRFLPRTDVFDFSNPRTEEEEEKTNNIWMKGHAGEDLPICYLSGQYLTR